MTLQDKIMATPILLVAGFQVPLFRVLYLVFTPVVPFTTDIIHTCPARHPRLPIDRFARKNKSNGVKSTWRVGVNCPAPMKEGRL